MRNQVVVLADNNGNVIRQSNNPEYGSIMVSQVVNIFKPNGWVEKQELTAFINGKIETLKMLEWEAGQKLPGNIVIIESTKPFDKNNPNKHLKIAGNSGVICATEDGEPIYRRRVYDSTGCLKNVLIPHANKDEIKESYNSKQTTQTETTQTETVELNQLGLFNTKESETSAENNEEPKYIVPVVGEVEDDVEEVIEDDIVNTDEDFEEIDEDFEFNL